MSPRVKIVRKSLVNNRKALIVNQIYSAYAAFIADDRSDLIEVQGNICNKGGNGQVTLTGNIDLIGYEAMLVAKNLVARQAKDFYSYDYHLHFTYPIMKKTGSSWGLVAYLLLGFLNELFAYSADIAALGEIDLYGNVRSVNFINEKVAAWIKNDSNCLILPNENQLNLLTGIYPIKNISEIPSIIDQLRVK